jgi:hypothetical protein
MTHVGILDVIWIGIAMLIQIHLSSNMDRNLSPEKQEGQKFIKRPTKYRNYKEK